VVTSRLLSDRYRLVAPIGAGGMSVVWQAHDEVLGRRVAVKLLNPDLRGHELLAEAKAAARLTHPNVCTVYDYGVADGEPYVVMELVDGVPLSARLEQRPLSRRAAIELCAHVAAALSAAHAQGLAHRDIKPANVMLTEAGVKVIDFGIAGNEPEHDRPQRFAGTPAFTAPERLGGAVGGPAADVYALGVLLHAALTGALPAAPGAPLDLPPDLDELYHRCLAESPADRPSAATLARSFSSFSGVRVSVVDEASQSSGTGFGDPSPVHLPSTGSFAAGPGTLLLDAPFPDAELSDAERANARPDPALEPRRVRLKTAVVAAGVAIVLGATAAVLALGAAHRTSPHGTATAAAPSPPSPASPSAAAPPCTVDYQVKGAWDTGATVSLTITNTGGTDIDGWRLEFALGDGLSVHSGWNGTWNQSGAEVTIVAAR
jgi:hypothetical protein